MSWVRDILVFIGVASLAVGLWWIKPSICLIVLGIAAIGLAVFSEWSNRQKEGRP